MMMRFLPTPILVWLCLPLTGQVLTSGTVRRGVLQPNARVVCTASGATGQILELEIRTSSDLGVRYPGRRGPEERDIERGEEPALIYLEAPGSVILHNGALRSATYSFIARKFQGTATGARALIHAQSAMAEGIRLAARTSESERRQAAQRLAAASAEFQTAGDDANATSALEASAGALDAAGDHVEAAKILENVASVCGAAHADWCEARSLSTLGALYDGLGKGEESMNRLNRSLAIYERLQDALGLARVHKQLGEREDSAGNSDEALRHYQRTLELAAGIHDGRIQGETLSDIGVTYQTMTKPERALEFYKRAEPFLSVPDERQNLAVNYQNMGVAYEYLGDIDRAIPLHRKAISTLRALDDKTNLAYALHNLGADYRKLGNNTLAQLYIMQSRVLFAKVRDARGEATALNSLGRLAMTAGRFNEALSYFQRALSEFEAAGLKSGRAYALSNIGEALTALHRPDTARIELDQAIEAFQALHDGSGEGFARQRHARLERDLGHWDDAQRDIDSALKIVESFRTELENEGQRADYFSTVRDLHEFQVDLLALRSNAEPKGGYSEQAFESCDRFRARSLLEALQPMDEAAANTPAGRRLQDLKKQIEIILQKHDAGEPASPSGEEDLQRLRDEYAELQARLSARNPEAGELLQPAELSLGELQEKVLEPGVAFIQYLVGDERSYAWVVNRNAFRMVRLPSRASLERTLRLLFATISNPSASKAQSSAALAEADRLLLKPLRPEINDKRLVISADDVLQMIPFNALAGSDGAKDVTLIPSLPVAQAIHRHAEIRKSPSFKVAVFSDPVYEADDPRLHRIGLYQPPRKDEMLERAATLVRGAGGAALTRLRHSADERQYIQAIAPTGSVKTFESFDASRDNALRTDFSQYRIVHYAVHGLVSDQHPKASGLVFSLYDEKGHPTDGFLRLSDIYGLYTPVDLVVLSACETARGRDLRGEGFLSLSRGFLYSGASRVISSLWQVPDQSTAELMKQFYRAIIVDRLTVAAALQKAQNNMARSGPYTQPYYWAGFTIYGDWK
jgi:CHAT domain-containing protein